jgi:hypothetical protein
MQFQILGHYLEVNALLYGLILGLFLTLGDLCAIAITRYQGKWMGLVVWLIAVLGPILVAAASYPEILISAFPMSLVLSSVQDFVNRRRIKQNKGRLLSPFSN